MKILGGVLVHRATRPLRGSVSCGTCSGWSVPCVSIQLTLSQDSTDPFSTPPSAATTAWQCTSVWCGSGWSVPCVSIQLTLSHVRTIQLALSQLHRATRPPRGSVSCGRLVVAGRYLVCRFNSPYGSALREHPTGAPNGSASTSMRCASSPRGQAPPRHLCRALAMPRARVARSRRCG